MTTIRSRRNPPGTRTRTYKTGSGVLEKTVTRSIAGTLLDNVGGVDPGSKNRSVTIEVNRTEGVAPAGFYFVAHASGFVEPAGTGPLSEELAHYTDLRYKWEFDEDGKVYDRMQDGENFVWDRVFSIDGEIVTWNKPGHPRDNPVYAGSTIKFLGIDKNKAFGPHTGIVFAPSAEEFARSGLGYVEKTIRVEVLSKAMANAGDGPLVQSVTVRVHDPEVYFGDANTAYISPSRNFPSAASNTFISLEAALTARRQEPRTRLLFNRNEVHDTTLSSATWANPDIYDEVHFGAYGAGIGDPVIRGSGLSPRARKTAGSHASTWGLRFQGDYEPAEPWVAPGSWSEEGYNVGAYANYTTVWDCHFEGFATPLSGTKDMNNQIVGNCRINKFWNYGYYSNIGVSKCNWSGVSIMQEWDAIITDQSDDKHAYYYNVHGPFRISHAGRIGEAIGYVSLNACSLRSLGGWTLGPQPCIRLGGNGNEDQPGLMRTSQDRILALMNGTMGNGVFKGTLYPAFQVWDKLVTLFIDSTGDGGMHSMGCSGVVSRNFISSIVNTPRIGSAFKSVFKTRIPAGDEPQDPSLFLYPIKTMNGMGVDLRDDTNFANSGNNRNFEPFSLTHPFYSEWIRTDNIFHTPNRSSGTAGRDTSNLPLNVVPLDCGLDYPGQRRDDTVPKKFTAEALTPRDVPVDTSYATSERVKLYVPEPGSPAYQTGDPDNGAIDDLYGNIRPVVNPSKGPIEPASVV